MPPSSLRIMVWNIAEGSDDRVYEANATLPDIAEQIKNLSPDIVLLNELHNTRGWPFGSGVNQAVAIANLAGFPYVHWGNTNATGLTGHKAVAVLSQYPCGSLVLHKIWHGNSETGYGTLEVVIDINNIKHYVFSTRFNSPDYSVDENMAGHQQSITLIRGLAPNAPVIFGGDFNSTPGTEQLKNFELNSGLKHACLERTDPEICGGHGADHLFYRGPYQVVDLRQRCQWPEKELSDHPWIYAELAPVASEEKPPPKPDRMGSFVTSDNDEIQYVIKADVVSSEVVAFQICLGQGLTWEKRLNLPDGIGNSWDLVVRDNKRCDTNSLWTHHVLNGQKLTFSKAKFLGYLWKVHEIPLSDLGNLPGGSLVTFTWVKD